MAESAEQASFGWAASDTGASNDRSPSSRTGPATARSRGARTSAPQRSAAKGAEAQLPPDNALWDVRAAARFLKRSVSWVYHKAEDGTLPVKRLDGWGVRFIPGELRAWVEAGAKRKRR